MVQGAKLGVARQVSSAADLSEGEVRGSTVLGEVLGVYRKTVGDSEEFVYIDQRFYYPK